MSARLDVALDELDSLLGPQRGSVSVHRVDVAADGILTLTVAVGGCVRWFAHDDRGLVEQVATDDKRIPLAERLRLDDSILAYRPGRRMVIRRANEGEPSVIKGYRRRRSEEAARRHRIAESTSGSNSFRVPRLFFRGAEMEALVFEEVAGMSLVPRASATELFYDLGTRLANFQRSAADAALETFTARDELGVLERWRSRVNLALGHLPVGWLGAYGRVCGAADRLPSATSGLCHRDLHDGQFLDAQGELVLLDFDLLCHADTALDPANLLAHLTLRSLQGLRGTTEASVASTGEAFLDGLEYAADSDFGVRLRYYQSTTFLRLALVYSVRPRWAHLVDSLVQFGSRCLDELEARC